MIDKTRPGPASGPRTTREIPYHRFSSWEMMTRSQTPLPLSLDSAMKSKDRNTRDEGCLWLLTTRPAPAFCHYWMVSPCPCCIDLALPSTFQTLTVPTTQTARRSNHLSPSTFFLRHGIATHEAEVGLGPNFQPQRQCEQKWNRKTEEPEVTRRPRGSFGPVLPTLGEQTVGWGEHQMLARVFSSPRKGARL